MAENQAKLNNLPKATTSCALDKGLCLLMDKENIAILKCSYLTTGVISKIVLSSFCVFKTIFGVLPWLSHLASLSPDATSCSSSLLPPKLLPSSSSSLLFSPGSWII